MSAPYLHPHRLAGITRDSNAVDWTVPDPYEAASARGEGGGYAPARRPSFSDPDQAYADAVLEEVGGFFGLAVLVLAVMAMAVAMVAQL